MQTHGVLESLWQEAARLLGLKRGTVKVVPFDPSWAERFQQERSRLQSVLGAQALDIQHIGSTAVAALAAKPVLDIGVAVAKLDVVRNVVERMASLGYTYYGDQQQRGDHFFAKGRDEYQICFVHMVRSDDPAWQDFLRFRDYLATHSEDRERYMRLKNNLAQHHADDRRAYTDAKAELIQEILAKARKCMHK